MKGQEVKDDVKFPLILKQLREGPQSCPHVEAVTCRSDMVSPVGSPRSWAVLCACASLWLWEQEKISNLSFVQLKQLLIWSCPAMILAQQACLPEMEEPQRGSEEVNEWRRQQGRRSLVLHPTPVSHPVGLAHAESKQTWWELLKKLVLKSGEISLLEGSHRQWCGTELLWVAERDREACNSQCIHFPWGAAVRTWARQEKILVRVINTLFSATCAVTTPFSRLFCKWIASHLHYFGAGEPVLQSLSALIILTQEEPGLRMAPKSLLELGCSSSKSGNLGGTQLY